MRGVSFLARPVVVVSTLALAAVSIQAANWPQFRGPGSTGVSDDRALPDRWSTTENIAWKTAIPGRGWSSPVVWGDRIFVTSVVSTKEPEPAKPGLYFGGERPAPTDEHRWTVFAIDFASGKIVWQRDVHRAAPSQSRHVKNSYASETPVTDGERVYVYFGNVGLFAFRMDGTPAWQQKWDAQATRYGWGTASSPVLHQGRLYVVNDNEENSFITALDAASGKTIWRVPRPKETNWATPYVWQHAQRTEIVTAATGGVRSYDVNGRPLWELKGMSTITIPTPFAADGLLYVASGYVGDEHRPVYAIRPGASGDISLAPGTTSNQFVAWYLRQSGPYNPSPIVYNGVYYTVLDRGFVTAHDAKTGKEIYGRQRLAPEGIVAITASPWAANGKIFALSEDGDTYVFKAGPTFEVVGKNSLGAMSMATPALANGSVILRDASHLYRIASLAKAVGGR
jgi:outer membrane protein assembly factor BamB